jgi:hypothetical protein
MAKEHFFSAENNPKEVDVAVVLAEWSPDHCQLQQLCNEAEREGS